MGRGSHFVGSFCRCVTPTSSNKLALQQAVLPKNFKKNWLVKIKQFSQLTNIVNVFGWIQLVNKALTIDISSAMSLVCYDLVHWIIKFDFFKNSAVSFSGKYEKHWKIWTIKPADYVISNSQFSVQMSIVRA